MKKVLALVVALALCCCMAAVAEEPLYISVISKGEQHAFWQKVKAGCQDAAKDCNVVMYYYGPPSEADVSLQVEALRAEMQKSPDAICLAALSSDSVIAEMQECIDSGIPVIGFDSGVPNAPKGAIRATVATNNENAAGKAAEQLSLFQGFADKMAAATPEKPMVIGVLSQDAISESLVNRTTGFVNRMAQLAARYNTVSVEGYKLWANPVEDAAIIIQVQISATADTVDVTNAASALLNMDGLAAIFLSNEGAVTGILAATSSGADLAKGAVYGDVLVVGFDSGEPQMNAIRRGWFAGSVTQDPYTIGYAAVEMAARAARGEEVSDVEAIALWYTADNIDVPEIQKLLYK